MATVAVFLALGGGAYALSLPRDSVTSRHIAKGQVKGSDIGKNAVKSAKVADFSLLAKDFRRGQLPEGPQGAPGATKVTVKAANGSGTVTAHCAAGESATGGGADSFEGIVVGEGPTTQPLAFYAPPDQAPFAGYVPTA